MTVKGGKGMNERELREKFVNKAIEYIGSNEGGSKHKYIIDTYNKIVPLPRGYAMKYSDHWCATFVSFVSKECGLLDVVPAECGCDRQIDLWKKLGRWIEDDSYVPKVGMVIYYDWQDNGIGDNKGASDHVGIVVSVTNGKIKVIEGNIKNNVGYRTIDVNGKYIRGYGDPDFASKSTGTVSVITSSKGDFTVDLKNLSKGSKGRQVEALQALLLGYGYSLPKYGIDGSYGDETVKAVKNFQSDHKLVVDGKAGPATWQALLLG